MVLRFALLFIWLFFCGAAMAAPLPGKSAIASAHPVATAAGFEVLEAGGNAFDAAVAVSATLAVVEPYSSGLGGGGFWLLRRARDGHEVMVDGRERAPLAAHRDMYLDDKGKVVPGLSMNGALAAGIPGEPEALVHIAAKYGRLPLARSLAPAIRAAREGFAVDAYYQHMVKFRLEVLRQFPGTARQLLYKNDVPPIGHLVKQPELAATLEALAREGRNGFYAGEVATKLVEGVRKAGGIWTLEDLQQYKVVEREPLHGRYRGMRITTAPPPSSGGVVLMTMLNILSGYELDKMDATDRMHVMVEAMRRAYRDRAQYLGDPDYVDMPLTQLTHPLYAAGLRASIHMGHATPSETLPSAAVPVVEGRDTTHFSIMDAEGNHVAATLSINYPFGSAFTPQGTGVLLNDEMDDFSSKPGSPNAYGLVGARANAIEPGKRMLSSMMPTFIEDERGLVIMGTPGGSRIITMVMLGLLQYAAGGDAASMVDLPRFHHQYLPDVIQYEPKALKKELLIEMQRRGHRFKLLEEPYGNMQVVAWDKKQNKLQAASDKRGVGKAEVR